MIANVTIVPQDVIDAVLTLEAEGIGNLIYDVIAKEELGFEGPRARKAQAAIDLIQEYAKSLRVS